MRVVPAPLLAIEPLTFQKFLDHLIAPPLWAKLIEVLVPGFWHCYSFSALAAVLLRYYLDGHGATDTAHRSC